MPVWAWNVLSIVCLFGFSYDLQVETWYISSTLLHFYKCLSWGWGGHKQNSIIMKKFFLFSLLCVISHLLAYSDVTKNVTIHVGETLTIDPYRDSGITPGMYTGVKGASSCSLTDPTMFILTTSSYKLDNPLGAYKNSETTVFTLVALKSGFCTFSSIVYYATLDSRWNATDKTSNIIYNITVTEWPKVISITIPNSLSLNVGENYTFSPVVAEPGANPTLSWSSTNPSVATVSNGAVQAVGPGTTTIICTAENGVSAQCLITVNPVLATTISINYTTYELPKNEMVQLTATVLPENATNKVVNWKSSNESVATVDAAGNVVGVSAGSCTITATTTDGSNLSASCLVTVPSDEVVVPSGDRLMVNDVVATKGTQPRLNVRVINKTEISVIQFRLTLPEGFSVATPALTERGKNLFVNMSDVSGKENCKMFNVISLTGEPLASGDGILIHLPLNVSGTVASGDYSALFDNVSMIPASGAMEKGENIVANITIEEGQGTLLGDMDGDGKVTVSDVTKVIDIYLEGTGE